MKAHEDGSAAKQPQKPAPVTVCLFLDLLHLFGRHQHLLSNFPVTNTAISFGLTKTIRRLINLPCRVCGGSNALFVVKILKKNIWLLIFYAPRVLFYNQTFEMFG